MKQCPRCGGKKLRSLSTGQKRCSSCGLTRKEKGRPKGRDHLNGIEGFWSYAKQCLYHYRGFPKKCFHLYLKEIEWRFNHRNENLVILPRDIFHQWLSKNKFQCNFNGVLP